VKRAITTLILASGPIGAQPPPRAEPVDQVLQQNPAEDRFQNAISWWNEGEKATDQQNKMENFARAAEKFDQYLREFPNHPNAEAAWYYLGDSYYRCGQPEAGRRAFLTLKNRFGDGKYAAAGAWTLAREHYNRNEYAFAAPLFELYAKNHGNPKERPRGNFYAGDCYRLLGRDREALNAFKLVIDDPSGFALSPRAKFHSAQILQKGGKFNEALAYFEEVANNAGNPPDLRGNASLGASSSAARLERFDIAEKHLHFLLTAPGLEVFRADAQILLMKQAFDRKQYNDVIAIYQKNAVTAEGEKEAARLMIAARAFMELKKPLEAQPIFRQIESLVPPENSLAFDAAYYRLHTFFQIEGRHVPDQVDAFLQIYRKTRPADDTRIHTALLIKAETLYANNDAVGASKVFTEINANAIAESNRPGLLYKRGWCLAETGDLQGAIRSLSDFISGYPKDERLPQAIAKRAKSYADSGETSKAIADFDLLTAEGTPADVTNMAWLESARLRKDGDIADMIVRYKALLARPNVPERFLSEANFYIGWGLVKTNMQADAVPFLEKAREIDNKTYVKHAGLLLCIVYGALQDSQKLAAEINLAIDGGYAEDISDLTVQWTARQAYEGGDFKSSARFYKLIANADDPRTTPKEVWRYLAKARVESGDAEGALVAVNHYLEVEENASLKADSLVDRGRALLALDRPAEARIAANEASDMRPQARTLSLLRLLNGDLFTKENNLDRAGAEYLKVVELAAENELKALALHKLATNRDLIGNKPEADKYRDQLTREFPNWKPPVAPK
jgi:tetratricopeptide (TPR) repeat protein